jgi:large subunit ribosomal protein L30
MARTFVWHPTRGPKKAPVFVFPKKGTVRIKQIRSGIGHPARLRATLRAIGLKHHQDIVVQEVTPGLLGQINKVRHLVDVTPVDEGKADTGKGKK